MFDVRLLATGEDFAMNIGVPYRISRTLDGISQRHLLAAVRHLASPYGLVRFVGAGLSLPLGRPGWTTFLKKIAPAKVSAEVDQLLARFEYEQAAAAIEKAMSRVEFSEKIRNEFGAEDKDLELEGTAAALIPSTAKGLVVKSKIDRVLEAARHPSRVL